MSKWTYEQLHMRYASLDGADSRELADAIRADIAAVEAERDELKRRLDAIDQKHVILQGSHDRLAKDRDELKRRLETVLEMMKPGDEPDRQLTNIANHTDCDLIWSKWNIQASLHARACAITEGRDNG